MYSVAFACWFVGASPSAINAQFADSLRVSRGDFSSIVIGANNYDKAGWAVRSGDVNGDGLPDLIVASSGASPLGRSEVGEVEIFWGGTTYPDSADLANADLPISRIYGAGPYIGLTLSLAVADFDGDGYDDIAIGLFKKPPFLNSDGMVSIVFGAADFPAVVDLGLNDHRVTRIVPATGSNGWFGLGLAAGNFDGDGMADLAIGQPMVSTGGNVYVVYGDPNWPALASVAADAPWFTRIRSASTQEAFGQGLVLGDLDGDGIDELVVGSPGNGYQALGAKVTILPGRPDRPGVIDLSSESSDVTVVRIALGWMMSLGLGNRMAVGDINGDGLGDLVLSDPDASPPGCNACGSVFIIFGREGFPPVINLGNPEVPVSHMYGARDYYNYGFSVLAGDFTGDGFDDVAIVNAHRYEEFRNEVIVVYGSADLPPSVALATETGVSRIIGDAKSTEFGRAMAVVDVNLDGVGDLAVGSYAASPFERIRAGRLYVFKGLGTPTPSDSQPPLSFALAQNFPNPFNPQTTIRFSIARFGQVDLRIYAVGGQLVRTLVSEEFAAGSHSLVWDGRNDIGTPIASGVYFCRLRSAQQTAVRKMVLLR